MEAGSVPRAMGAAFHTVDGLTVLCGGVAQNSKNDACSSFGNWNWLSHGLEKAPERERWGRGNDGLKSGVGRDPGAGLFSRRAM